MFSKSIMNITGYVPFTDKAFPMTIEVEECEVVCKSAEDIPQSTDFIIIKKAND